MAPATGASGTPLGQAPPSVRTHAECRALLLLLSSSATLTAPGQDPTFGFIFPLWIGCSRGKVRLFAKTEAGLGATARPPLPAPPWAAPRSLQEGQGSGHWAGTACRDSGCLGPRPRGFLRGDYRRGRLAGCWLQTFGLNYMGPGGRREDSFLSVVWSQCAR